MQLPRSLKVSLSIALATAAMEVPADAQTLPIVSPSALANHIGVRGMPTLYGFRIPKVVCGPGRAADRAGGVQYAYACGGYVNDAARPGKKNTVIVAIYNGRVDFARQAAFLRSRVDASPNRWKVHTEQDVGFTVRGRRFAFKASCHQALGVRNGPASCALQIAANVTVIATAAAKRPSTAAIGTGSYDDIQDAAAVLAAGAIPVAEFVMGSNAPAPVRRGCEGDDPIFKRKGC